MRTAKQRKASSIASTGDRAFGKPRPKPARPAHGDRRQMSGPPDAHVGDRDQNRGGALVAAVGLAFGILEARLPARDRATCRDFMGDKETKGQQGSLEIKKRISIVPVHQYDEARRARRCVRSCGCCRALVEVTGCQRIAEPSTISVHELHTADHPQGLPIQNFEDQSLIDSCRERRRSVRCCSIYCERRGWTVGSAS